MTYVTEKDFSDLKERVRKLEEVMLSGSTPTVARTKKSSPKEFLMGKQVKTDTNKVLALAYFLERHEGLTVFNTSDLETVFRLAKEKLPKNMNDTVNKNITRGLLMEAAERKDSKKAWSLTSSGERYVEKELNK